MSTINDILKLDLTEDIKNVIDLEDQSENEIQTELESYILTDGLAKHLSDFINAYTSNIKETGVWISGFYGSGKSYFGKMLGHILANQNINGTPARDRFLPRIKGVKNESFLENDIRKLDAISSKVIFLDIAKQNTEKGLAFTLFSNFLKKLGFREDLYGFLEYDLLIDGKTDEFEKAVQISSGKPWSEIKRSNRETARAVRQAHMEMGYSEKDYEDTKATYEHDIDTFSAGKLRDQLKRYLEINTEEVLVFIFDEASEAISQQKFNLLDLEGLSEALSSLGNNVWTIAIAQEKLDDVINNANISKSHLTKVTDRFKSPYHLESTEVDIIIRNRLLQKNEHHFKELQDYYKKHEGQISDITNLKSTFPTKTEDGELFATYYPFHKYQFDLLQKFLFTSNQLAASQIAARGMIITTFDVLRKRLRDKNLYVMSTAHSLCSEAQTAPPTALGIKYENGRKILAHHSSEVDGEKLLKTIHFMTEAELVSTTIENITKAYIENLDAYYVTKPKIQEALDLLEESKILLSSNHNYKITSDLEGKLLEEMQSFTVELFTKKRYLVTDVLKKISLFKGVATLNLDSLPYKFNILTDQDDDIEPSSNKYLGFTIYSLFNMDQDRQDFVEGIKMETQYEKGRMILIPDNAKFNEIDQLLTEVKRFSYMEDKYKDDHDNEKRRIIREFIAINEEKEKRLFSLVREAYSDGSLIYLYDEYLLNENTFKGEINQIQGKLIRNIYTKRLASQLSDAIATKVLKERDAGRLQQYFSGADFNFFDGNGNFVGDNLKVVEEIRQFIESKYLDGKSLRTESNGIPWGYSYGTIASTLAALFRAGKVVIKYGGAGNQSKEYFSFKDKAVHEVFTNSRKFSNASFKAITKSLTAKEKNEIVQRLLDLEYKKHTDRKVDWNTSDFELADALTLFAEHFLTILNERKKDLSHFNKLFPEAAAQKEVLMSYTSKTTERNYIEKAQQFLEQKEQFKTAIESVQKANEFIRKNLQKLNEFNNFTTQVKNELTKAAIINANIQEAINVYEQLKSESIVKNFAGMQKATQRIKDVYYELMQEAADKMTAQYKVLLGKAKDAQKELEQYPEDLNRNNQYQLNALATYAQKRIVDQVDLKYNIICKNCGYSFSDILNYQALFSKKETELLVVTSNFVKTIPEPSPQDSKKPKTPRKLQLTLFESTMSVKNYKDFLTQQLQSVAGMDNEDLVEVKITQK